MASQLLNLCTTQRPAPHSTYGSGADDSLHSFLSLSHMVLDPCYYYYYFGLVLVFESDALPRGQGRNSEISSSRKLLPPAGWKDKGRRYGCWSPRAGLTQQKLEPWEPTLWVGEPCRGCGHCQWCCPRQRVKDKCSGFPFSYPPISHWCQIARGQGPTIWNAEYSRTGQQMDLGANRPKANTIDELKDMSQNSVSCDTITAKHMHM